VIKSSHTRLQSDAERSNCPLPQDENIDLRPGVWTDLLKISTPNFYDRHTEMRFVVSVFSRVPQTPRNLVSRILVHPELAAAAVHRPASATNRNKPLASLDYLKQSREEINLRLTKELEDRRNRGVLVPTNRVTGPIMCKWTK
jgi:hypothetical protein